MRLADSRWTDVVHDDAGTILVVPLGSTEQHGPHLPLSTDTDIAIALCERLAAARDGVVVAPAVAYGASGEHAGFPGTLSIGSAVLEQVVVELGRSATDSFAHVLLVSAHGGNAQAVRNAVAILRDESRDVEVFMPSWTGDLHAGHVETSAMLALRPDAVVMSAAEAGVQGSWHDLGARLRVEGVRAVSANGVLGDPTAADPDAGEAILAALTADLLLMVETWRSTVLQ